jgi:hypothetical protein
MQKFLGADFTITKQQLGFLAILVGLLAAIGLLLFDQIGLSDPQGGFGPSQLLALAGATVFILVGLSLLPLGDSPA